jgi:hypothetical protein
MTVNGQSLERVPAVRDERGRLMPGSRIGVGNLGQHHRGELRRALITADTPENIGRIGQKLIELALGGDVAAARLYLEHTIGKPRESLELAGVGGTPLSLGVVMMMIREIAPEPERQAKLAAMFRRLALEGPAADGSLPGCDGRADGDGPGPSPRHAGGGLSP